MDRHLISQVSRSNPSSCRITSTFEPGDESCIAAEGTSSGECAGAGYKNPQNRKNIVTLTPANAKRFMLHLFARS